MKTIIYKGEEFQYQTYISTDNTDFYQGIEIVPKYNIFGFKFGKLIERPKLLFTIDCNIEHPRYSKEFIRRLIRSKVKVLNRDREIQNGDII
jgi:hypothetical protein